MKRKKPKKALIKKLKQDLRQLRQKYALQEYLTCEICGEDYINLGSHVRVHGLFGHEYRRKFGLVQMTGDRARLKMAYLHERIICRAEIIWLKKIWEKPILKLLSAPEIARILRVKTYHLRYWCHKLKLPIKKLRPAKQIWTKEIILGYLRARARQRLSLKDRAVYKADSRLYYSAINIFGSYRKAIEALDLNYDEISYKGTWSKVKIINYLQKRVRKELPINREALTYGDRPSIMDGSKRFFGSLEKAIEAAGFNYDEIKRYGYWSKPRVVKLLRERKRQKLPMNDLALRFGDKKEQALLRAAKTHFPNYEKAIEATGFNYAQIRKLNSWSKEKVIKHLRQRARQGLPINARTLYWENRSLYNGALRYFKTYAKAVEATGLNYDKIRLDKRAG